MRFIISLLLALQPQAVQVGSTKAVGNTMQVAGGGAGALTFVNSAGNHCGGNPTTCAATYSPTAGDLIICDVYSFNTNPSAPTACTDNATGGSTAYSQAYNVNSFGGIQFFEAEFFTCNVKSGVTTISANAPAATTTALVIIVSEYKNNPTSGCFDTATSAAANATSNAPLSNSITPASGQNEVINGQFQNFTDTTAFGSSGSYTLILNEPDNVQGNGVGVTAQIVSSTSGSFQAAASTAGGAAKNWFAMASAYK